MDDRQIIQRLMEIHGNSISALCGKLVQANVKTTILHEIIKPLEALGQSIRASHDDIARQILDTAYALRVEAFFFEGNNAAIVEFSSKGMSVASPDDRSYYCFALSAAESHFKLDEPEGALKVLATAIWASLGHGCEQREVPALLKFLSRKPLERAQGSEIIDALSSYAERIHGIRRRDFEFMWLNDPTATIDSLLAKG